ncbi:carboxypeptidase B-like [Clavelina lepadiformis]|uniref:carboxypeptidase B-like n=1 Tax=Clavelina lepadiformis TaxID=159417 RepID=UPI00404244E7
MKFFALIVLIAGVVANKRFDKHQVLTLYPTTPEHLSFIQDLENDNNIVDFWSPDDATSVKINEKVDVRFSSAVLGNIKMKLQEQKMDYEVKIANLQQLIDEQLDLKQMRASKNGSYDYNVYHTYDEIQQWIADTANQYPNLARKSFFATSTEGRNVDMLTIGKSTDKPIFLIDCGVHAREWISPAFCQCFINRMLSQYGVDPQVTRMMDEMTWMIIPLLNVDGYEYTWANDRMWRKTRSKYDTFCTGVDANRNFDINWSGEGASTEPCSNTYCGPSVESEPVVKALSDIIRKYKGNIQGYIAFHSYSQVFVYPYSYAYEDTENAAQLNDVSSRAANAIQQTTSKIYTFGPGYESMYLVSGGSKDWAYQMGVPLSYTIELRDTGKYGFLLPESQIDGTCQEMFQAMIVLAEEAITNT